MSPSVCGVEATWTETTSADGGDLVGRLHPGHAEFGGRLVGERAAPRRDAHPERLRARDHLLPDRRPAR